MRRAPQNPMRRPGARSLGLAASSVGLVPYDDRWPALFQSEAALLRAALDGQVGRIAHVGSTAIPGMEAKPILDLMAEVPSLRAPPLLHWTLCRYGYLLEPGDDISDRLLFIKQNDGLSSHHLSICEPDSQFWHMHLQFRDRLRADQELAADYLALKRRLSSKYRSDRTSYTRGKAKFITHVLGQVDEFFLNDLRCA